MRLFPLVLLVFFACVATFWRVSDARFVCPSCATEAECDKEPSEFCMWGEARDFCNRRVCAKGPGERCNGPFKVLGQCGEGTICAFDERCHGCSTYTFQCYSYPEIFDN